MVEHEQHPPGTSAELGGGSAGAGAQEQQRKRHGVPASESALARLVARIDAAAARSKLGRLFELKARRTTLTTELRAAVTVFLTVSSLIALNPAVLSGSGGPCTIADCTGPLKGTPQCRHPSADHGYAACVAEVSRALVSTTCLSSAIGCWLMALLANLPLVLAPGMGVNTLVAYSMVGAWGSGALTYAQAMAVVLVTSALVLIVSLLGLRGRLMQLFPPSLVFAMVVGIGLFLASIGLRGIGLVVADPYNLLAAGGCTPEHQASIVLLPPGAKGLREVPLNSLGAALQPTDAYACRGGVMSSPITWLGIAATLLMVLLEAAGVQGSVALGVLFATAVAWIPGHGASYFSGPPGSPQAERFADFKQVVSLPNPGKTSLLFDFTAFRLAEAWSGAFALLYIVFLDSTGTTFALAGAIDTHLPGFVKQPGFVFPRRTAALVSDALSCVPGALMGTSPLIVTAESSVAVEQGGRTGLVPLFTGCFFLVSAFFAPLVSNIPPYATGPALIVVGSLMARTARFIDWSSLEDGFPAFVTIALTPLTGSIANGLLGGLAAAFALWLLELGACLVRAAVGRDPDNKPSDVLKAKFATYSAAFGDITVAGFKADVAETFARATTMRRSFNFAGLSRAFTGSRALSDAVMRMGSVMPPPVPEEASSDVDEGAGDVEAGVKG